MKRWIVPFAFLLVALTAAFYYQQQQAGGRAGFPAPDFALNDLYGRSHRLADLRGKVVFLNLWATWCPPCRMEMPSMEHLHRRLQGTDFAMLAVSEDDESDVVRSFVDEMQLTFPIVLAPAGQVPPRYGVTGYPETFIIDRNGQVIQHFIGPEDWDSEQVYRYFVGLLDQKTPPAQAGRSASELRG